MLKVVPHIHIYIYIHCAICVYIQTHTEVHTFLLRQIHTRSARPTIAHAKFPTLPLSHRCKTHTSTYFQAALQTLRLSFCKKETRLAVPAVSIKGQKGDRFVGVVGRCWAKARRGERTVLFTIAFLTVSLMLCSPLLRFGGRGHAWSSYQCVYGKHSELSYKSERR